MPFQIKKEENIWKIWRINEKNFINKSFKSRESALKTAMNYMLYRHPNEKDKIYISGNKVLIRK